MPSLHKFWKLKASLKSTSGYKGGLFQGGGVKPFFDKGTSNARKTKPPVAGFSTTTAGHSLSRHPLVSSFFSKLFSSSRTPAADNNPSIVVPSKHQALSRVLATPSIHGPFLRSCCASEGARETNGCSLREPLETRLYFLTGQLPGGTPHKAARTVPKQVVTSVSSRLQDVWKEQRLCDRSTATDTDGVVIAEAFKHKWRKFAFLDSRALVVKVIDRVFEGKEGGEGGVQESGHFRRMLLERSTIQGLLGMQKILNHSIAHNLLHPETSVPYVENIHAKSMINVRLAGVMSPGLVIDGNYDFDYAKGRSRNLDNERLRHRSLRLLSAACCLPHPKKVKTGGEDAYFICSQEQVVGVADGVGGWADVGVDAGNYARELMLQSKIAVAQEPLGYIDPARVMLRAHAKTKCRGSSTACILALSDNGLQAANLGDSGFMLMRNGRTIFKSPVQQHQFNIPFQLESGGSDPPGAAEVFSLQVAAGDVLVAGTDGLFDNLYDNELMGVVIHSTRAGLDPQVTAQKIVALARERAEDCYRQTPFSTAAQEAGFRFYGGKLDDITVIVSYITNVKSGFLSPLS